MIENKKDFAIGFLLCLSLSLTGFGIALNAYRNPQYSITKDNVYIIAETQSGKGVFASHNVITNIGENHTRYFHSANTTSENGVIWISIGNASASSSLTQLTSQYGSRFLGDITNWENGGDYAYNITATHQFTETQCVNAAGAHWSNTGDGNLYAVANFAGGAVTFNSGDNITITWVFTFDCN